MRLSTKPQLPLHSRGSQRDCHVENFSHAGPCYLEEKPRNKELVVTFLVEWCQNDQGKLEFQPLLYTYISILLLFLYFFSPAVVLLYQSPHLAGLCTPVMEALGNAFPPLCPYDSLGRAPHWAG